MGIRAAQAAIARRFSSSGPTLRTNAVGVGLLLAFETLHVVLATPEYLWLLGGGWLPVVAWYAVAWLTVSLLALSVTRDERLRALLSAGAFYFLVSLKVLAQETTLLWRVDFAVVFGVGSLMIGPALYLLQRWLRFPAVAWIGVLTYYNVIRLLKRAWQLHPSELSTTELVLQAGLLCLGGAAVTTVVPLALRRPRFRLACVPVLMSALAIAIAVQSKPLEQPAPVTTTARELPDVYVVSVDALRQDVFEKLCDVTGSVELRRLCSQGLRLQQVVADGISTYQVLTRNLRGNGPCELSVPGSLAREGYTTAMYLGRRRKRLTGADCFHRYYSGGPSAFVDGFSVPSVGRRLLMSDAQIVKNKLVSSAELLARFAHDTSASRGPVFAYLHLLDLHAPYGGASIGDDDRHWTDARKFMSQCYERRCSDELIGAMKGSYLAVLRDIEQHVQTVVRFAEGRRRPYRLIVTSDHGELFGEHEGVMHSNGFVPELLSIPFLIFDSTGRPELNPCALMLSSTALRVALGEIPATRVHSSRVTIEGPPLGHAVISATDSVLEYFIAPEMQRDLGTPKNVHPTARGVLPWSTYGCSPLNAAAKPAEPQ